MTVRYESVNYLVMNDDDVTLIYKYNWTSVHEHIGVMGRTNLHCMKQKIYFFWCMKNKVGLQVWLRSNLFEIFEGHDVLLIF